MKILTAKEIEMANVKEYLSQVKKNKILLDDIALMINPWHDKFVTRRLKIDEYRKMLSVKI